MSDSSTSILGEVTRLRDSNGNGAVAPPRISVVIPALNEAKLIEQTLESFDRETRARFGIEVIVSDGGSDDGTIDISRELADKVVEHREKRRQTIAEGRNAGARVADGDLLVFINADTRPCNPDLFLKAIAAIDSDTTASVVAWACPVAIAPDERKMSDLLFHGFFNRYVRLLNLCGLGMGRGECQIIRREAFERAGRYADHMAAGEDFDLYRRLSAIGKIGHDQRLKVYESPRRFRRFGYLRVLFEWSLNGLAVMALGRSISKEWEQIR